MKSSTLVLSLVLAILIATAACAPGGAIPPRPPAAPALPTVAAPAPAAVSQPTDPWAQVEAAARKEGRLNAYSFSLVGETGIAVAAAFRKRYGINVEIVTGPGASLAERIRAEKRAGQLYADFHDGSPVNLHNMKATGLLTAVYPELPVSREKGVWHLDPVAADPDDRVMLALIPVYFNPYINTNLVKAGQEPKAYSDFLDRRWEGKLSIVDPVVSPGAYQMFVPLLEKGIVNEDYIKALGRQQLRFFTTVTHEMTSLSRGEHEVSIRGSDAQASAFVREGAPVKAIALKEGTLVSLRAISAIAGGPHPNATKLFIDWILGPEGQAVYTKSLGLAPLRKDVADSRPDGVKAPITTLIVVSTEHDNKAGKLMNEKWLSKLWGK